MGVTYGLIRLAPETVAALEGRPRAAAAFIYGDPDLASPPKRGFLARLLGKKDEESAPVPERRDGDEIDLDKSWHIVHFLLTGSVERVDSPLGLIADDLHPIADIDPGVGAPNLISAAAVRSFADKADKITDEDFLARFVPDEMPTADLYLGDVISRGDHEDMKEYALENFNSMRIFARIAADNGEAIVTYYS